MDCRLYYFRFCMFLSFCVEESTSASIEDEIEKIKNEKNLREEQLKTPNKDMRNIPIPEGIIGSNI